MSLCDGAITRVFADSRLSEQLDVKVGMPQGSVLSPFVLQSWLMSLKWQDKVCYVCCCMLMI